MSERVCPKCLTSHACACPKPSAPTNPTPKDAGAREWWIERNAFVPGLHVAVKEKVPLTRDQEPHVVHVIEYAAYEKLLRNLNQTAHAGELSDKEVVELEARIKELEREQVQHIDLLAKQYEAELTQVRAELLTCKGDLACALTDLSEARAELAEADGVIVYKQEIINDLEERSAALVEALEKIANHKQTSIDKIYLINQCEGYQTVAREALAKFKGVK